MHFHIIKKKDMKAKFLTKNHTLNFVFDPTCILYLKDGFILAPINHFELKK